MCSHRHVILLQLAKLLRNQTIRGTVMAPYRFFKMIDFSRWRPWGRKYIFGFGLVMTLVWEDGNLLAYQISIRYRNPWLKTTSGFGKRTAAILEFYFLLWLWPNFRHRRDFLHFPTKVRRNRTMLGGVMTSYRFFQDGGRQPYWIRSR